ncbi:MAG: hypothetical protein KAI74_08005 [Kiritimatiellae bacterium]|nr:hypothetical protein [Kiritimatiellia bacterium]
MDNIIIFLVMFATIVGPSFIMIGLFAIPVILLIRKGDGKKLTTKIILVSIAVVFALPVIAELIAVVTLLVLFQIFGQG